MARKKRDQRRERRDSNKRVKKKVSVLDQESIGWVDYKDVELLKRFMSDRAKIRARRVTGNNTQQQKAVARAIKLARELALLPYTERVATSARGKRRRRDDDDGDDRDDRRGPRRDRDDDRGYDDRSYGGGGGDDTGGDSDDTGRSDHTPPIDDTPPSDDAPTTDVAAGGADGGAGEEE